MTEHWLDFRPELSLNLTTSYSSSSRTLVSNINNYQQSLRLDNHETKVINHQIVNCIKSLCISQQIQCSRK